MLRTRWTVTRRGVALSLLVVLGCGGEPAPPPAAALEREAVLGPFLAGHWRIPTAPQGAPPAGFSEAEASLEPAICGACHPEQHAQWSGSLHAAAHSPGLAGQLIEGALADPAQVRACQSCHAPLAEQQPFDAALRPNRGLDAGLRAQGLVCAGCHVRAHRHFGPPRRAGAAPAPEPRPHGGFEARAEYLESRFCAECHQFFNDVGINGKPVENTYAEWLASPQAAAGRQCQDCHMPDRAHLWRGIHDPEMVRQGVDVELFDYDLSGPELRAALVLRNRDVGHAFPTYVTPRVSLALWQADAGGAELAGTRVEGTIGREVDLAAGVELMDTRVLPGESVVLDYSAARAPRARALVARVVIDPDFHYRGVFAVLLGSLRDPVARELIEEASRRIAASDYVLTETRRPLSGEARVP